LWHFATSNLDTGWLLHTRSVKNVAKNVAKCNIDFSDAGCLLVRCPRFSNGGGAYQEMDVLLFAGGRRGNGDPHVSGSGGGRW
jgi:hypothetical protein